MLKRFSVIFLLLGIFSAPLVRASTTVKNSFRVLAYETEITPNMESKSITGQTRIRLESQVHGLKEVRFSGNGLKVQSVMLADSKLPFRADADGTVVQTPSLKKAEVVQLAIRYSGQPSRGLMFERSYIYSSYFTCDWMICRDDPGEKAPFTIHLTVPKSFKVVASGALSGVREDAAKTVYSWKQDKPYSTYVFGFAAGEFTEVITKLEHTELRYLGVSETPETLRQKFKPTADMLLFFEEKAGIHIPQSVYTQVLVPGTVAQEVSSFSIVGKDFVDPILADPQEDWVIAHELAHQWWGNLVTCKSWQHGWLNEGLTVFMVAAYKEHHWGRAAYDKELQIIRRRYQKAIDAGFDVPLTYSKEYPSLQMQRAIMYSKGAIFLDTLRNLIGEKAFWNGLRLFTQKHAGGSVESRDFETAMGNTSGRDLSELFKKWVYE